jgi:tRNA(Arg) A34 adenosine deaminase TadA
MDDNDVRFMRAAIDVARTTREEGNHPFGAVLVDEQGRILMTAGNATVTTRDCTAHAETRLVSQASVQYDPDFLAKCTIYASAEPCPMCAGAIFWANVRRVVYGLSQEGLYQMIGKDAEDVLYLPCREVLARGQKPVEVLGPVLEDEAREVHVGFWR